MLRYKTETRPGLVALYDIRPGNGTGQFLQPRSPHRAGPIISNAMCYNCIYLQIKWPVVCLLLINPAS